LDLRFGAEHEAFRAEAREWLTERLDGPFASVKGRGGPGDEAACVEERRAWELELGAGGWIGLSWPKEYGGREVSLLEQVVFFEEYARAGGPGRVGIVGEGLLGPTLVHFANDEQKRRFLPGILSGREIWCQGYSEPNAGSDLANVQTQAVRDGDEWVVTGQKVWTSLATWAQWCFVLCRTNRDVPRHRGLSYLLVPMDQPGIEIRPIRQLTGTAEFNEVFFSEARTPIENVVGAVDGGWSVAMGTLAFERGASTLGQQLTFEHELHTVVATARSRGLLDSPPFRQRVADAWIALRVMRYHALRSLSAMEHGTVSRETSIHKLYWAGVHQRLGELAIDSLGSDALTADPSPHESPSHDDDAALARLFLWSRADTIYGGSDQIQRNVIGERALGLPAEPKVGA
jgi:alkylation response protein AidB-like acyl-CoA dehydrogenase